MDELQTNFVGFQTTDPSTWRPLNDECPTRRHLVQRVISWGLWSHHYVWSYSSKQLGVIQSTARRFLANLISYDLDRILIASQNSTLVTSP